MAKGSIQEIIEEEEEDRTYSSFEESNEPKLFGNDCEKEKEKAMKSSRIDFHDSLYSSNESKSHKDTFKHSQSNKRLTGSVDLTSEERIERLKTSRIKSGNDGNETAQEMFQQRIKQFGFIGLGNGFNDSSSEVKMKNNQVEMKISHLSGDFEGKADFKSLDPITLKELPEQIKNICRTKISQCLSLKSPCLANEKLKEEALLFLSVRNEKSCSDQKSESSASLKRKISVKDQNFGNPQTESARGPNNKGSSNVKKSLETIELSSLLKKDFLKNKSDGTPTFLSLGSVINSNSNINLPKKTNFHFTSNDNLENAFYGEIQEEKEGANFEEKCDAKIITLDQQTTKKISTSRGPILLENSKQQGEVFDGSFPRINNITVFNNVKNIVINAKDMEETIVGQQLIKEPVNEETSFNLMNGIPRKSSHTLNKNQFDLIDTKDRFVTEVDPLHNNTNESCELKDQEESRMNSTFTYLEEKKPSDQLQIFESQQIISSAHHDSSEPSNTNNTDRGIDHNSNREISDDPPTSLKKAKILANSEPPGKNRTDQFTSPPVKQNNKTKKKMNLKRLHGQTSENNSLKHSLLKKSTISKNSKLRKRKIKPTHTVSFFDQRYHRDKLQDRKMLRKWFVRPTSQKLKNSKTFAKKQTLIKKSSVSKNRSNPPLEKSITIKNNSINKRSEFENLILKKQKIIHRKRKPKKFRDFLRFTKKMKTSPSKNISHSGLKLVRVGVLTSKHKTSGQNIPGSSSLNYSSCSRSLEPGKKKITLSRQSRLNLKTDPTCWSQIDHSKIFEKTKGASKLSIENRSHFYSPENRNRLLGNRKTSKLKKENFWSKAAPIPNNSNLRKNKEDVNQSPNQDLERFTGQESPIEYFSRQIQSNRLNNLSEENSALRVSKLKNFQSAHNNKIPSSNISNQIILSDYQLKKKSNLKDLTEIETGSPQSNILTGKSSIKTLQKKKKPLNKKIKSRVDKTFNLIKRQIEKDVKEYDKRHISSMKNSRLFEGNKKEKRKKSFKLKEKASLMRIISIKEAYKKNKTSGDIDKAEMSRDEDLHNENGKVRSLVQSYLKKKV